MSEKLLLSVHLNQKPNLCGCKKQNAKSFGLRHLTDLSFMLKTLGIIPFRKEVIHPQIPLRIPCYDLVLLADPAVFRIEKRNSGIANSADLTGGVYKDRERIHRGIADPRLLAIPASWRRVAASNPNWAIF